MSGSDAISDSPAEILDQWMGRDTKSIELILETPAQQQGNHFEVPLPPLFSNIRTVVLLSYTLVGIPINDEGNPEHSYVVVTCPQLLEKKKELKRHARKPPPSSSLKSEKHARKEGAIPNVFTRLTAGIQTKPRKDPNAKDSSRGARASTDRDAEHDPASRHVSTSGGILRASSASSIHHNPSQTHNRPPSPQHAPGGTLVPIASAPPSPPGSRAHSRHSAHARRHSTAGLHGARPGSGSRPLRQRSNSVASGTPSLHGRRAQSPVLPPDTDPAPAGAGNPPSSARGAKDALPPAHPPTSRGLRRPTPRSSPENDEPSSPPTASASFFSGNPRHPQGVPSMTRFVDQIGMASIPESEPLNLFKAPAASTSSPPLPQSFPAATTTTTVATTTTTTVTTATHTPNLPLLRTHGHTHTHTHTHHTRPININLEPGTSALPPPGTNLSVLPPLKGGSGGPRFLGGAALEATGFTIRGTGTGTGTAAGPATGAATATATGTTRSAPRSTRGVRQLLRRVEVAHEPEDSPPLSTDRLTHATAPLPTLIPTAAAASEAGTSDPGASAANPIRRSASRRPQRSGVSASSDAVAPAVRRSATQASAGSADIPGYQRPLSRHRSARRATISSPRPSLSTAPAGFKPTARRPPSSSHRPGSSSYLRALRDAGKDADKDKDRPPPAGPKGDTVTTHAHATKGHAKGASREKAGKRSTTAGTKRTNKADASRTKPRTPSPSRLLYQQQQQQQQRADGDASNVQNESLSLTLTGPAANSGALSLPLFSLPAPHVAPAVIPASFTDSLPAEFLLNLPPTASSPIVHSHAHAHAHTNTHTTNAHPTHHPVPKRAVSPVLPPAGERGDKDRKHALGRSAARRSGASHSNTPAQRRKKHTHPSAASSNAASSSPAVPPRVSRQGSFGSASARSDDTLNTTATATSGKQLAGDSFILPCLGSVTMLEYIPPRALPPLFTHLNSFRSLNLDISDGTGNPVGVGGLLLHLKVYGDDNG